MRTIEPVMLIKREPLVLVSSHYSREHGVRRSDGCHVSAVIDIIMKASGDSNNRRDDEFTEQDLERLRTLGFTWERTMIDEDDEQGNVVALPLDPAERERVWELAIERHAKSVVADPGLEFPGERMFCVQCEQRFSGKDGRRHCRRTGHKGIFGTVDALMSPPRYRYGVKEWKWTGMSAKRTGVDHLDGIRKWPLQVLWYANMFDADYVEIDAMFSRGDYSTHKPCMMPFRFHLEPDERDLQRNRIQIISTARSEGMV